MVERFKGELPYLLRLLAAPAGLLPLGFALTRAVRDLARRRPALFERLGPHRRSSFLIDPSDLPFAFLVVPDGVNARIQTVRKRTATPSDVHVRGPLLVLLGLLDGAFDGDALFFNRAIAVSGKTDALVALRNAIEDAELQPSDLIGLPSSAAPLANGLVLRAVATARRLTGATMESPQ